MRELSLNVLDIAQNSIAAGASVITMTVEEDAGADRLTLSVEDNGCGMTEETRKHIFEKFYQGDTSHAMAGNGLGLALALRVLQLNDYKIEVESEPGRGSKFTVIIPKR